MIRALWTLQGRARKCDDLRGGQHSTGSDSAINTKKSPGRLALCLAAFVGAASPAWSADAPVFSVDATVTVDAPALPATRRGRRELLHAFGKDAAPPIRALLAGHLADLKAFREFVPEAGEYRLATAIERATADFRDLGDAGHASSTLTVAMDATCSWFDREGELILAVPVSVTEAIDVRGLPTGRHMEAAFATVMTQVASRAFGALYEARFSETIRVGAKP